MTTPEVADLRTGTPLTVWVSWEDAKEPSHVLKEADHTSGTPVYHTICGLTFKWGQDKTGPYLLWRGWYLYKLTSDCEACIYIFENDRGRELPPLLKGVVKRYIDGEFVEVTDEPASTDVSQGGPAAA